MSDPITIPANEHGVVRIFLLSYQLDMEIEHSGTLDGLADTIGVANLRADDVQLVKHDTITELGLPTFLEMAYAIVPDDLRTHQSALAGLTGQIAIIRSGAFEGKPVTFTDSEDARLIATLHEDGPAQPRLDPLQTTSAEGILDRPVKTKAPKSDARIGGMIATYALIFMFALVGLMIWVGGS